MCGGSDSTDVARQKRDFWGLAVHMRPSLVHDRTVLDTSGTAEEALLKRCAHYDIAGAARTAEEACGRIVQCRQAELQECCTALREQVAEAYRMLHGSQAPTLPQIPIFSVACRAESG